MNALSIHKSTSRCPSPHEDLDGYVLAQRQAEYCEHYGLILTICRQNTRKRLARGGKSKRTGEQWAVHLNEEQLEEYANVALAESWDIFRRLSRHKPSAERAKLAGRMAARRATARFLADQRRHAHEEYPEALEALLHYIPEEYRDPDDRREAEKVIGELPEKLQPTARLASYGMRQDMISERTGTPLRTVQRRYAEIRDYLDPKPNVYEIVCQALIAASN